MDNKARPTYSALRTALLKATPGDWKCRLYCSSAACKYCTPRLAGDRRSQAIAGLYSDWVTPEILAMARPLPILVKHYRLIEQFKDANITAVFNLQEPGEHAHCGPGLGPSGFTYEPEWFMNAGIMYHNFPLPDFEACTPGRILEIAKVATSALMDGRIAVHCHAGHGRTGMLIAAILLFRENYEPSEAVNVVRAVRAQSVQSQPQIEALNALQETLLVARTISLQNWDGVAGAYEDQKKLLCNKAERFFIDVPAMISIPCKELLRRNYENATYSIAHISDDLYEIRLRLGKAITQTESPDLAMEIALEIMKMGNLHWRDATPLHVHNVVAFTSGLSGAQLFGFVDRVMNRFTRLLSQEAVQRVASANLGQPGGRVRIRNREELLLAFLLQVFSKVMRWMQPEIACVVSMWCSRLWEHELRDSTTSAVLAYMRAHSEPPDAINS